MRFYRLALPLVAALLAHQAHAGTNLVTNGDFETNTGVGQIDKTTTATGWTSTDVFNGFSTVGAFNFILDGNADSTGFPSENSPPNIKVWGPNSGVNNGFTGSSNGGYFLGGDGGYATGALTQTISGLTVGKQYELTFEWAGAQFTDVTGDYWVGWDVSLGSETHSVTSGSIASQGFLSWANASMTFTASSTSEVLSFLATGPTGLPPFSLLDGVSLMEVTTVPAVPEPASLAMMLAGGAVLGAARRRQSKKAAKAQQA